MTPESTADRTLDLDRLIGIRWGDRIIDPAEVEFVLSGAEYPCCHQLEGRPHTEYCQPARICSAPRDALPGGRPCSDDNCPVHAQDEPDQATHDTTCQCPACVARPYVDPAGPENRGYPGQPGERLELPSYWSIREGIKILDPDGWDRQNFVESWNTPITLDEFNRRALNSTTSKR